MTDDTPAPVTDETASSVTNEATPAPVADEKPPPVADDASLTPAGSTSLAPVRTPAAHGGASAGTDRPEIIVGAAFAAGFTLAMVLRRLVR